MKNQVVIHYLDGSLVKGLAVDFFPNKETFHVTKQGSQEAIEVNISELKGIFFVKDFEGNSRQRSRRDLDRTGLGRKIRVDFKDGETLIGYTTGYSPGRVGFFVFPADPEGNNERIFVITDATEEVAFL